MAGMDTEQQAFWKEITGAQATETRIDKIIKARGN
jgi:hypothetical protein